MVNCRACVICIAQSHYLNAPCAAQGRLHRSSSVAMGLSAASEASSETLSESSHSVCQSHSSHTLSAESAPEVAAKVHRAWEALHGKARTPLALAYILTHKLGLRAFVRTGEGTLDCRRLSHSFIVIRRGSSTFIADPFFRDQFQLGLHDPEYARFLQQHVPELFVATPAGLSAIVRSICKAMHAALARLGLGLPPWRQTSAVLSKWAPSAYRDEQIEQVSGWPSQSDLGRNAEAADPRAALRLARRQMPPTVQPTARSGGTAVYQPAVVVQGFELAAPAKANGRNLHPFCQASASSGYVTSSQQTAADLRPGASLLRSSSQNSLSTVSAGSPCQVAVRSISDAGWMCRGQRRQRAVAVTPTNLALCS